MDWPFQPLLPGGAQLLSGGTGSGSFTADAVLKATRSSTFTADAVLKKTLSGSFTADAVLVVTFSQSFTANAITKRTQTDSLTADAIKKRTISGSFTADAVLALFSFTFTADAVLKRTQTGSVTGDAVITTEPAVHNFTADAIKKLTRSGSVTADARLRNAFPDFDVDAILRKNKSASFAIDAYLVITHSQSFTADSFIFASRTGSFFAFAEIRGPQGSFTANSTFKKNRAQSFTAHAQLVIEPFNPQPEGGVTWVNGSRPDAWQADSGYSPGSRIIADGNYVWYTNDFGDSGSTPPDFSGAGPVVDNDLTWIRVPVWTPTTPTTPGTIVQPTVPNGFSYTAANNGTTDSTEPPEWAVVGTVGDGTGFIVIRYDGADITPWVIFADAMFIQRCNGRPGQFQMRVKDKDHIFFFEPGKRVTLDINGQRQFDGYAHIVSHRYAFPVDYTTNPDETARIWEFEGPDLNILFQKRFVYDQDDPSKRLPIYPAGTTDEEMVDDLTSQFLNLAGDDITVISNEVGSPNPNFDGDFADIGMTWGQAMQLIGQLPGAVFYLSPDRELRYEDDDTEDAPFALDDEPFPEFGSVGYSSLAWTDDGARMVNDALVWGAGTGRNSVVFGRETSSASIENHGLWQLPGQYRYDVFRQTTVNAIAQSIVEGSPQNLRGAKDPAPQISARILAHGLRAGMKVSVRSGTFNIIETIPVRQMKMTFPTPTDVFYDLEMAHEIDQPWNFAEFAYPKFPPFPPYTPGPWVWPVPSDQPASVPITRRQTTYTAGQTYPDDPFGEPPFHTVLTLFPEPGNVLVAMGQEWANSSSYGYKTPIPEDPSWQLVFNGDTIFDPTANGPSVWAKVVQPGDTGVDTWLPDYEGGSGAGGISHVVVSEYTGINPSVFQVEHDGGVNANTFPLPMDVAETGQILIVAHTWYAGYSQEDLDDLDAVKTNIAFPASPFGGWAVTSHDNRIYFGPAAPGFEAGIITADQITNPGTGTHTWGVTLPSGPPYAPGYGAQLFMAAFARAGTSEVTSGSVCENASRDGVTDTYFLSSVYQPTSTIVTVNGAIQRLGIDYAEDPETRSIQFLYSPGSFDVVWVCYFALGR